MRGSINYILPSLTDPEGDPTTINAFSKSQSSLPSFITLYQSLGTLVINPVGALDGGLTYLILQGCDGQPLCSQFALTINVTVLPPRFLQDLENQTITIGDPVLIYQLPQPFDPYSFSLSITAVQQGISALPSFVRFNQTLLIFRIAPKSNLQIGDYLILVTLSDGRTSAT